MPPKLNRKANYSLAESRFLVEKFKLHAPYFENNWTNGSRFEKTEVWQDIFNQYCDQFPHTDRTALDIRRKLIKLRSEAKMIMQREQLKAEGANIQELLSERTLKLSVSPAHKMMMKAMRGDEDWAADHGDFVEYEVEFEDEEAQDDEDDIEYVGDGDEEDQSEGINPERIIKKLFHPAGTPITMALARKENTKKNSNTYEPNPKKRKHHAQETSSSSYSLHKTTADDLLQLQKQNLEMERKKLSMECDNLLLMQKKLKLEVKLIEQQLAQSDGSSSKKDKKDRKGGSKKSQKVPAEETLNETESESTGQENKKENGQEGVQEEKEVSDAEENGQEGIQEEMEVPEAEENGQEGVQEEKEVSEAEENGQEGVQEETEVPEAEENGQEGGQEETEVQEAEEMQTNQ